MSASCQSAGWRDKPHKARSSRALWAAARSFVLRCLANREWHALQHQPAGESANFKTIRPTSSEHSTTHIELPLCLEGTRNPLPENVAARQPAELELYRCITKLARSSEAEWCSGWNDSACERSGDADMRAGRRRTGRPRCPSRPRGSSESGRPRCAARSSRTRVAGCALRPCRSCRTSRG